MKALLVLVVVLMSGSVLADDFVVGQVKTDTSVASQCDQDRIVASTDGSGSSSDSESSVRQ